MEVGAEVWLKDTVGDEAWVSGTINSKVLEKESFKIVAISDYGEEFVLRYDVTDFAINRR